MRYRNGAAARLLAGALIVASGTAPAIGQGISGAMTTPNRQPQPNDMRRSTTDGRNDQLRYWLADGNFDVAVVDFTGMPTGVELVDFYQERMVLIIANSL